jgi:hypothetical protein
MPVEWSRDYRTQHQHLDMKKPTSVRVKKPVHAFWYQSSMDSWTFGLFRAEPQPTRTFPHGQTEKAVERYKFLIDLNGNDQPATTRNEQKKVISDWITMDGFSITIEYSNRSSTVSDPKCSLCLTIWKIRNSRL